MNWLQFNDFHIGGARGPQRIILKSMLETVASACAEIEGEIDAVFLVGDLAWSGKAKEYQTFKEDFLDPLRKIENVKNASFFAVPGNHDVDCDKSLMVSWASLPDRQKVVFFQEDEDGIRVRRSRAMVFEDYRNFALTEGLIGPDPEKEVGIFHSDNNLPFDIVAINTAFFSDKDEDSSAPATPAPLDSLRHLIPSGDQKRPIIILGHHPVDCFLRQDQRQFKTLVANKNAIFIHGHEHDPKVTFDNKGYVQTLGFGASYLTPSDKQNELPWHNSFTLCSVQEQLCIRSYTWEPHPGNWQNTTKLVFSDCEFNGETAMVRVPLLSSSRDVIPVNSTIREMSRSNPKIAKLIPLSTGASDFWPMLYPLSVRIIKLYQKEETKQLQRNLIDGKLNIVFENSGHLDLVVCISGLNHVLSAKEIESFNTQLDTTDYNSITVISLGKISEDAQTMYSRLRAKKAIEVLTNTDLTRKAKLILSGEQNASLSQLDAAKHSVQVVVDSHKVFLLVVERIVNDAVFWMIDNSGEVVSETEEVVVQLREDVVDLAQMRYYGDNTAIGLYDNPDKLDIRKYLATCYKEYNVLKYAALASIGIRFSDLPLDELYVDATASEVDDGGSNKYGEIVADHIASIPASDALKDHLEKQLLETVKNGHNHEVSGARDYCQKYSAILVTGDPGSGKSCFLKNEILAYCKALADVDDFSDVSNDSWYANHLPVMVVLSEFVSESDEEDSNIFDIVSRLLMRKGLPLSSKDLSELALQGKIAWFFDGLDEIVSIEKRAKAVKHINSVVEKYIPFGCRVVVTSRPAAVHVVNLLPDLHKLELQGLSEPEIRTLASRVLSFKLKDGESGVVIDEGPMAKGHNQLINQLVSDCQNNPGVGRLAKNPLLLTLLIMIYANSGSPSAKRHLIYQDAIETLASARRRDAGHKPISVQDLRTRLGAVALSVYRKSSGLLPSRREVREIIKKVMLKQIGGNISDKEADDFIQRVAESTGLIAIETNDQNLGDEGAVTFMHHSFLEYFAAVGLAANLDNENIDELVNEQRWYEILTLLSGIIGDQNDVAPILERILNAKCIGCEANGRLLLFAMDCALECDVPSEVAQRLIGQGIKKCIETEAGRVDPWIRLEIGKKLARLLENCGGGEFDMVLANMIVSEDLSIAAAAISLVGVTCSEGHEANVINDAIESMCISKDEGVLCAICYAGAAAKSLRTPHVLGVLESSLDKGKRLRRAALKSISGIPALALKHWSKIINGIDNKDKKTAEFASVAAIQAGLNAEILTLDSARKDVLIRAFRQLDEAGISPPSGSVTVSKDGIVRLLDSTKKQDRLIGLQLMTFSDCSPQFIHDTIFEVIETDEGRDEVVAALSSLKYCEGALDLITQGDLLTIKTQLTAGTIDVRLASASLLACFSNTELAVESLLNQDFSGFSDREFAHRFKVLSSATVKKEEVAKVIENDLSSYLLSERKLGESGIRRLAALLESAANLGQTAPRRLSDAIHALVKDHKQEKNVKKMALLCYPSVVMPTERVVLELCKWYINPPVDMDMQLVQVVSIFARNIRRNIDYVFASVGALPEMRTAALSYHALLMKRTVTEQVELYVSELRSGISDLTEIMSAFDEMGDIQS